MNISDQGIRLLMLREGKRNNAYLDSVGVPTIGVGHTGPDVHLGLVWTDEQVEQAFRADLERFEAAINANVHVPLEQYQFDALVSWLFNVGEDWAHRATLIKDINAGNMTAAAEQFDQWHIPPEITSRRNGEKAQFMGTMFEATITIAAALLGICLGGALHLFGDIIGHVAFG